MPAVKRASRHITDRRVHDCIAAVDRWTAGDESIDLNAAAEAAQETEAWAAWLATRAEAWEAWEVAAATGWSATERNAQRNDLLTMFPPIKLVAK